MINFVNFQRSSTAYSLVTKYRVGIVRNRYLETLGSIGIPSRHSRLVGVVDSFPVIRMASTSNSQSSGPVQGFIEKEISAKLSPTFMRVENESYMHNVPKGSETHFKVVVVSDAFDGKTLIQRHRMVNSLLENEIKGGIHALSITAKTPQQWENKSGVEPSPRCLGGSKR